MIDHGKIILISVEHTATFNDCEIQLTCEVEVAEDCDHEIVSAVDEVNGSSWLNHLSGNDTERIIEKAVDIAAQQGC